MLNKLVKPLIVERVRSFKKDYFLSNQECLEKVKESILEIDDSLDPKIIEELVNEELEKYTGPIDSKSTYTPNQPILWVTDSTLDGRPYWETYKNNLIKYQEYSNEMVESLRKDSLVIVNYLASPSSELDFDESEKEKYQKKGLVYGNVQSGKTASMGGVISQYVSMGCRIVLVLSGTLNNLWDQTNSRLRRDLGIDEVDGCKHPWEFITDDSDNLRSKNVRKLDSIISTGNSCVFGVFKKNPRILRNLIDNFLTVNDDSFFNNHSVLIIDDECDQASIDTKNILSDSRTAINGLIVELLGKFSRYAYIGYTATPFANILNEPPGANSLYPSDFIVSLPESPNYFSAAKIFGYGEEFSNIGDRDTLNCVNRYDKKSIVKHELFDREELELLRDAMQYFFLATACKFWRAEKLNNPKLLGNSTMMIHNTQSTQDHRDAYSHVSSIYSKIVEDYDKDYNKTKKELFDLWNHEFSQKEEYNLRVIEESFEPKTKEKLLIPQFEDLLQFYESIIKDTSIIVDNSQTMNKDRLHYESGKRQIVIAIGGNTLSRGITLEGLVVSFFTRQVNTYDTLLQMGRWFGYKKGFEDLMRIWIPTRIAKKFEFLAGVEYELRESISRYRFDTTPKNVAISIRTNPHMKIVRKMAMQSAELSQVNFSGHRPQTVYFENNDEWLQNNIDAAKRLIFNNSSKCKKLSNTGNFLFESISFDSLDNFINKYLFHPNSSGLNRELLNSFIKKARKEGYIKQFNLVLKTIKEDSSSKECHLFDEALPPNKGFQTFYLNRTQISSNDDKRVNLKAITSPNDILADIPDQYKQGMTYSKQFEVRNNFFSSLHKDIPALIVLYPIYSKSTVEKGYAKSSSGNNPSQRKNLALNKDIIGVCFVFPNIERNSDFLDRVSIPLTEEVLDEDN